MGIIDRIFGEAPRPAGQQERQPEIVRVGAPFGVATPQGYGSLMSVDYAACEQTKARSLSSLPWTVVRDGSPKERMPDHPIARLLSGMANEDMTSTDLLSWHRLRCDTFGVAYWRFEWRKGQVVAIWPVTCAVSKAFDMRRPEGKRRLYFLAGDDYNEQGTYFSDEVVPIRTHITKNGCDGMSLAKIAAEQIGLSVDLERFYRSMLENGNHHFGHVEVPDKNMPEPQRQDLQAAVEAKSGIGNAGKAPIFAAGAKWVNDQQTMRDASLIEQQEWVLQQVCRACNVPPWKVYHQKDANYAGSQQMSIDYVTETILPDTRAIEQAVTPVLRAMGHGDCQLKANLKGLMRGDDAARSQYYRELAYMGAYTREMICELEDVDPPDGVSAPLFPLNYGTVNPDGTVNVFASEAKEPGDGNQSGATD